jgi:hypothetical protein
MALCITHLRYYRELLKVAQKLPLPLIMERIQLIGRYFDTNVSDVCIICEKFHSNNKVAFSNIGIIKEFLEKFVSLNQSKISEYSKILDPQESTSNFQLNKS